MSSEYRKMNRIAQLLTAQLQFCFKVSQYRYKWASDFLLLYQKQRKKMIFSTVNNIIFFISLPKQNKSQHILKTVRLVLGFV
jgi:hypothetical protein